MTNHSNRPLPSVRTLIQMLRPGFLTMTLVASLLGLATSAAVGTQIHPADAVATVLLAMLAHAAANVWNDYHDAKNGADAANHGGMFPFSGGARLIQRGIVTANQTRWLALALTAVLVAGGLALAWGRGPGLLKIGLVGLWLGWAYSAPPLALMARGVGELVVAAAWWLVVFGSDYVQTGHGNPVAGWLGYGFAVLVANVLLANSIPDAPADAQVGKRTLVTRLGVDGAIRLYLPIAIAAHLWLAAGILLGVLPLVAAAGLISLPLAFSAARFLRGVGSDEPAAVQLRRGLVLTIACAHVHGAALALALCAGTVLHH